MPRRRGAWGSSRSSRPRAAPSAWQPPGTSRESSTIPFVYYVSVTGVTGSGALQASDAGTRAGALRAEIGRPVVVGFGIDSRDKARQAAGQSDGVVVGTALVRAVEEGRTAEERRLAVERLVRELRAGVDEAQG